jgi:FixJ family two-component response regulator
MSEAPLIAIVDDDELARDGMRELVESFGYAVATFTSAERLNRCPLSGIKRLLQLAAMSVIDPKRTLG